VALIPHYFDRTGTAMADDRAMARDFEAWMETVADAVTYASGRPNVDPARIGLLGFSLGGYLALSLATRDTRIKAVVEFFGGLPDLLAGGAARLPPDPDPARRRRPGRPGDRGAQAPGALEENNVPHEVHIYRGAGHVFLGADGVDSGRRTRAFFDAHLKATPG
jgi:carboxymethylenebutenolidase